ncbi:ABC transporter ATP-binding protein [Shimia sp. MMG029]|uniref:ABC transporter ATP-binding protein n=1 Tax=Shimia sp. MMG029 TaxID=3021978 RepID=UPI0022FF197D|nr:ABC transporter ATP-binding protein [Shimia sp. MMG029]MDA5558721.1 ABC transporter ATP-binding protein [Shimia sp. MMG029]
MSFLSLKNLNKQFGDFTAVRDMTLSIEKGEFVSLLGPSGCGKTTTLQMIAGLLEPTSGQILLDGRDISHTPPNKRGLGIVFQSYALFPHMSALDNVAFGLEMRGVGKAERQDRARKALEQVKLGQFMHRFPKEMSGGQRQRVALARALVIEPPVLLLDEPLSNLDAKLREDMRLELRLLQQEIGVTTILVTHDQEEALSMSDRIVVMKEGEMEQIAAPLDLYERPVSPFVSDFVGKTNLFNAEIIDADHVKVAEHILLLPGHGMVTGASMQLSIRPEKFTLSPEGDGDEVQVEAAIFHGANWLYRVRGAMGELFITQPNTGAPGFARGQTARLTWPDGALSMFAEAS